jgi:hypothetical protein
MDHIYLLLGFILLIIFRFLLNISKYFYLQRVISKQDIYIDGKIEPANNKKNKASEKAENWIQENQIEIKKIVLKTGIQDQWTSYMEPLGLGKAKKESISALDNLTLLNPKIMGPGREIVNRAKGFYKIQALKSFNPLFWVEFIVFLPKELLKYFSVDEDAKSGSVIIKIFQVIYWIASIYFMYQTYVHNAK